MQIAKEGRVIYQKAVGYHTFEAEEQAQNEGKNDFVTEARFETGTKADVMDGGKKGGAMPMMTSQASVQRGKVQANDLYDLASVTKISTSALAVMQLMSENKFSLDATLGTYYPAFKGSNKENLTFRDMLTHRSGLKAWIPFWMDCIDTLATLKQASLGEYIADERWVKNEVKRTFFQKLIGKKKVYLIDYESSIQKDKKLWLDALHPETITWKPGIFSKVQTNEYNVEVADSLWLRDTYREFILNQIKESPVKSTQGYVYSDLHYYLYPEIIQNITSEKWEDYLKKTYKALGATTLTYNPRKWYSLDRIVPTEIDTLFRKTMIHGRVHDEGAGLLSGISGHAGLFGNANDLMKLMQMYLQKGEYGGHRFISSSVLAEVTKYQFPEEKNRRAIAFDKLDFNPNVTNGPRMASPESYGHSGFTGTFTWMDPTSQLVYVFLSNRVYPTRDNGKISTLNIRTAIGDEIYKAMKK
jgi:CubicO group peptidase (beta-lactamase class C family)